MDENLKKSSSVIQTKAWLSIVKSLCDTHRESLQIRGDKFHELVCSNESRQINSLVRHRTLWRIFAFVALLQWIQVIKPKPMSNKHPNGCVAWEGNSLLDGTPIVLILTCLEKPNMNVKTGQMVQSIVIRQDMSPLNAVLQAKDSSVCGNCPLRRGTCYVDLRPYSTVWRVYKKGKYPPVSTAILERAKHRHRQLRITAYGDPAAVPLNVWEYLLSSFSRATGYTHQWRNLDASWSKFLMASCDRPEDFILAQERGWSTFRVINEGDEVFPGEILCPNRRDDTITCETCGKCSGNQKKLLHIVNPVHGLSWKKTNFRKLTE